MFKRINEKKFNVVLGIIFIFGLIILLESLFLFIQDFTLIETQIIQKEIQILGIVIIGSIFGYYTLGKRFAFMTVPVYFIDLNGKDIFKFHYYEELKIHEVSESVSK